MIFQDLQDLKDACIEAASGDNEVKDFEAGVFCGKYKTVVPADYFEHLGRLHEGKKSKAAAIADGDEEADPVPVANGGPVNVAGPKVGADTNGTKSPENQEDIRYVADEKVRRLFVD